MTRKIETTQLNVLKNDGVNVCFIKGNRQISNSNVSSKCKSLNEFGILIPLMYVKGTKAVEDGCSLVSIDNDDIPASEADKYIAIIDGQHRFKAAVQCDIPDEEIFLFETSSSASTKVLLAEANITVDKWRGSDYVTGAILSNLNGELGEFVCDLNARKYSVSTISLILCFNRNSISNKVLSRIIKGELPKFDYNIKRAKDFIDCMKGFEDEVVSKRYFIEVFISLSGNKGYERVCAAIQKLDKQTIARIQYTRGEDNIKRIFREAIEKKLEQ